MQLVLAPWEWSEAPGEGGWRKPGGDYTGGCLDLRTLSEAGSPGPTPSGLGLFAYEDLPVGIQVAADLGDDPLAVLTLGQRRALATALGLDARSLGGSTLADLLAEFVLGVEADPSGAVRTKPLRMNRRGTALHLRGFGELYRAPLDKAHPVYAQTLAVRRLDYERNRALVFARAEQAIARGISRDEAEAKALAALQRWTGHDKRALDATEDELLPARHRSDGSREPATVLTETWPSSSTTISSGQDQTWEEDQGDVDVSGGALHQGGGGGSGEYGRCTNDLSSDDHYHECDAFPFQGARIGATVRKVDSSTRTYYFVRLQHMTDNTGTLRIAKFVSGSETTLDEDATDPGSSEQRIYVEADGSSIYGERGPDGSPDGTVGPSTDTDITGNLQCGYHFQGADTDSYLDNHEFGDLAVADPEGPLVGGKLVGGGILAGRLVG